MSALIEALVRGASHDPAEDPGDAAVVLVTGVDRPIGAALAEELVSRGLTVHGTHEARSAVTHDIPGVGWHLVPRPDDAGYLPALHRIVQHHRVRIIVPTLDAELLALAGARRWPDEGVFVDVSGPGPVHLAQDKLLACWQLSGHRVPSPSCASPSDFADAEEALGRLGGALVVRARRTGLRAGGARIVHDVDEIDWDRIDDDFVIQELVQGREFLGDLYRADGSTRRALVLHEVVRPGLHQQAVTRMRPGQAEDVERMAWAAVRALGVSGPAEVVLRRTDEGRVFVLSVHPRFGRHCGALLDQLVAPGPVPRQGGAPDRAREANRAAPVERARDSDRSMPGR